MAQATRRPVRYHYREPAPVEHLPAAPERSAPPSSASAVQRRSASDEQKAEESPDGD